MSVIARFLPRLCTALLLLVWACSVPAAGEPLRVAVINLRSATLTAQYWNPILDYVGRRSGIPLQLQVGRSQAETVEMINRGDADLVVSGTIFSPQAQTVGYRVVARTAGPPVQGQIVVARNSPLKAFRDIAGKEVGFSSRSVFIAYALPMNEILRTGIEIQPSFAGNQEGVMGQLASGRIQAAAVHSQVMREFSEREGFAYRVLWSSEKYMTWPVAVHPRLPAAQVAMLQAALLGMQDDPEGQRLLATCAAVIKQQPPYGFVAAAERDYDNYRRFYKTTLVRDCVGCPPQ